MALGIDPDETVDSGSNVASQPPTSGIDPVGATVLFNAEDRDGLSDRVNRNSNNKAPLCIPEIQPKTQWLSPVPAFES